MHGLTILGHKSNFKDKMSKEASPISISRVKVEPYPWLKNRGAVECKLSGEGRIYKRKLDMHTIEMDGFRGNLVPSKQGHADRETYRKAFHTRIIKGSGHYW